MNKLNLMLLLFAFFPIAARAQEKAIEPFFPMGLWYEGGVGDVRDNVLPADPDKAAAVYDRNFADIAAHGVNVITVPNSPPNHHKILLDAAQKHGLKVILELGLDGGPFGHMIRGDQPMDDAAVNETLTKVLDPIRTHPALLRVQLLDEPPGGAFERYRHIADLLRAHDPKTPPFCCLTGGSDGGAFLRTTGSNVVAFDMYPIGVNIKPGDERPLKDFATYAGRFVDWADQNDAASWAVIQCHDITGALRAPTAGELRCMTYAALATGNRGVFWFLYQTESFGKDAVMGGLVDRSFKPRPLWHEVGTLAQEIKPLLATLAKLKPQRNAPITCTAPGMAYALRDENKKLYVFAVNFDSTAPQKLRLTAPAESGKVTNVLSGAAADTEANSGPFSWFITLPPGGGALFRVE
jgi:hypothetical protein